MIESQEEEKELSEIDSLMMMMNGHEQFKDNPVTTIINALNKMLKDKAISDIKKQHPGAIIIERPQQHSNEE
jgi:hypothetical protein